METLNLIDLIKYPIITDKATKLLELNQYSFAVAPKATKQDIKSAVEFLFKVRVVSINTCRRPVKLRRVGKFLGYVSNYKKTIVTLAPGNAINLFSDS